MQSKRLTAGKHRRRLDEWRGGLTAHFQGRILQIDVDVAEACGRLVERISWPTHEATDAFIAQTREVHGLTLVSRKASDVEATVRDILTPLN